MIVVAPRSLDEALDALRDATAQTRLLAGGTDLMVELDVGRARPDRVVDLARLAELRGVRAEDGGLRLGALATCTELLRSPAVRERADILAEAAREFGALAIRNRATLGGNLGTASPAADLNPVLLALGASVRLRSARATRDVPAAEFLVGYRRTARRPDELIESVFIPPRPSGERRAFRKVGTRRAQSIAKVVVALALVAEQGRRGPRVLSLAAAAGSVAERTLLLPTLARRLAGQEVDLLAIEAAARAAVQADVAPIDDVRSSAEYRREVLYRVLRRLLAERLLR